MSYKDFGLAVSFHAELTGRLSRLARRALLPVLFVAAVGLHAADSSAPEPDALDRALALIGTSRSDFRVDPEAMMTIERTSHRLSIFDKMFSHPLRIPFWERHMRDSFIAAADNPGNTFQYAARILGLGTCRDLIEPTPVSVFRDKAKKPDALKTAILALDANARVPDVSSVPSNVQETAAMILFASAEALQWRETALRKLTQDERKTLFATLSKAVEYPSSDKDENDKQEIESRFAASSKEFYMQLDCQDKVDLRPLLAAGDDLSAAITEALKDLAKGPVEGKFHFICETCYGKIILNGADDDAYAGDANYILILDAAGDDTYNGGGASLGADLPLGMILDAAGNDTYDAKGKSPSFGTGILGWGLLADLSGNDKYSAPAGNSQGCGIAGAGMLVDVAGDDSYDALGNSQGFGYFGVGIIIDNSGNDSYSAYSYSQACGLTVGVGLLLDMKGDDKYVANDTDIRFPSAQSPQHNCSMAQGAGCGDRRDYVDNKSAAGGVGILLDAAGNDSYFGGVFSQAVGYWFGIGILDDRAGNDSYRSVWYGQSATAHFAISYLADGGGSDLYTSTNCVNVGASHDYSASIFVDEGGDDKYEGASNCGQALNDSVALFVDIAGNDTYAGGSFGQSTTFSEKGVRSEVLTRALFLDLAGDDKYPGGDKGNNRTWIQQNKAPVPRILGAGSDCEGVPLRWDIDPIPK